MFYQLKVTVETRWAEWPVVTLVPPARGQFYGTCYGANSELGLPSPLRAVRLRFGLAASSPDMDAGPAYGKAAFAGVKRASQI